MRTIITILIYINILVISQYEIIHKRIKGKKIGIQEVNTMPTIITII